MLPDFIIAGAPRCGTSSLRLYLKQNPDTCVRTGEVNFFSNKFNKGIDWYKDILPDCEDKIIGEKSPTYFNRANPTAHRIKNIIPKVKFIILFRDPVVRFFSSYYRHDESINMNRIINLYKQGSKLGCVGHLEKGIYDYRLEIFLDKFPRGQFFIVKSERFYSNTKEVYKEICDFLDIDYYLEDVDLEDVINKVEYSIDEDIADKLTNIYDPHNQNLNEILNYDIAKSWRGVKCSD